MNDLKAKWEALVRRAGKSAEIGAVTVKGMTWDLLTQGKSPSQVREDIDKLSRDFDEAEKNIREKAKKSKSS